MARLIAGALLPVVVAAALAGPAHAQREALPAAGGAVAGVVAGGYLAVSIVVVESRFGRYIHDLDDVLSWRSAPIVGGGVAGLTLGVYSQRRLEAAAAYGAGGLLVGGLAGMGLGAALWEPPEGRWAGAAIGAGAGLLAGAVYGAVNPWREPDRRRPGGGVPVGIVVPLR